jgi:hypothetical protein
MPRKDKKKTSGKNIAQREILIFLEVINAEALRKAEHNMSYINCLRGLDSKHLLGFSEGKVIIAERERESDCS